MFNYINSFIFIIILMFTHHSIGLTKKTVTIGFANIPPYAIEETHDGMLVEIFKESFKNVGYEMSPLFASNKRLLVEVLEGRIDGFAHAPHKNAIKSKSEFYDSNFRIDFSNFVIALKSNNFSIKQRKDLANLKVIGFQNAKLIMGHQLEEIIPSLKNYEEPYSQFTQVVKLLQHRTDAIISDKYIFKYFQLNAQKKGVIGSNSQVNYYDVFPPNSHIAIFKKQKIRDDFNKGFELYSKGKPIDKVLSSAFEKWKKNLH